MNAERPAVLASSWTRLLLAVLALAVVATGCAKRPAVSQASAPAPTGAAVVAPPPAPPPAALAPATRGPEPSPPAPTPPPPRVAPPPPKEFAAIGELRDVHFDFDRYAIRPRDAEILRASAQWLRDHADQLVLIEGHCDERGTNEYNQALGERRAKATMNFLVGQGIKADRITLISYGEERPLCTEHNESCWSQNRRAHMLVKPQ